MEDMGVLWTWKCNCCVCGKIKKEKKSKELELGKGGHTQGRKAIWTLAGRFGFYVEIILPDFNHNY